MSSIIRDEDGNTPLMAAILEENEDLAVELLDAESADLDAVNYDHFSALQLACRSGLVNVALQLIDLGVDTHYISGEGFRALDYTIDLKDHALKIVSSADAQMRFASEDELWDDVCEWRTDKEKHRHILDTIDPLIESLESQDPDASMSISDANLKTQFDAQIMRYIRNGRSAKGVQWDPKGDIILSLFFLHLMRTYRSSQCYVNDLRGEGVGVRMRLDLANNRIIVSQDAPKTLKNIASQIATCVNDQESAQVIVPIILENVDDADFKHMNLLVFREKDWVLEHYEPHGKTNLFDHWTTEDGREANARVDGLLKSVFQELVDHLTKRLHRRKTHKSRGPVRLSMASESCPSHRGFQALHKKDPDFEKHGLCAVWALFIAEMAATYPGLSLRQIQSAIYAKMQEYDKSMAGEFLMNIMKGYVLHIVESTRIYADFFDISPEEWALKVFQWTPEMESRISWLAWFETWSFSDKEFISRRVKLHKNGDPNVPKEEWENAEMYLRMKRVQECASRQTDAAPGPDHVIRTSPVRANSKTKKTKPSSEKRRKPKSRRRTAEK